PARSARADPATTNNRMELRALIEAYRILPADSDVSVYSDSQLCVKTINEWAAGWAARGWRRKPDRSQCVRPGATRVLVPQRPRDHQHRLRGSDDPHAPRRRALRARARRRGSPSQTSVRPSASGTSSKIVTEAR
ncbi:MAG: hypothetical protein HC802_14525, partial [Caldilineaceae bacterium]|nr:hypothetical protein [Caldilineaceae bacterium]